LNVNEKVEFLTSASKHTIFGSLKDFIIFP